MKIFSWVNFHLSNTQAWVRNSTPPKVKPGSDRVIHAISSFLNVRQLAIKLLQKWWHAFLPKQDLSSTKMHLTFLYKLLTFCPGLNLLKSTLTDVAYQFIICQNLHFGKYVGWSCLSICLSITCKFWQVCWLVVFVYLSVCLFVCLYGNFTKYQEQLNQPSPNLVTNKH